MTKHLTSSRARRWTIQSLLVASVVGLGIAAAMTRVDQNNPVEAAQVEAKIEPVDPWVYDRTQGIRRELALTNADLASMGLGLDESKTVLNGLKDWVEQNREQLEAKDRAVQQARRDLQLAQRSVRVGPRDEAVIRSLPGLEKAFDNAATSLQSLHESAGQSIEGRLTNEQRTAWQTARANVAAGVPSRYRYATNLSEAQRERIKEALSRRGTDQGRSKFTVADQELSASQSQTMATAKANLASNIESVMRAEEEALPRAAERPGGVGPVRPE